MDKKDEVTDMIFYYHSQAKQRRIKALLEPQQRLLDLKLRDNDVIVGTELITPVGKQVVQKFY